MLYNKSTTILTCQDVVDLLWICCTACCTTNPQQISPMEFAPKVTDGCQLVTCHIHVRVDLLSIYLLARATCLSLCS